MQPSNLVEGERVDQYQRVGLEPLKAGPTMVSSAVSAEIASPLPQPVQDSAIYAGKARSRS
jgi:hypothetical protein